MSDAMRVIAALLVMDGVKLTSAAGGFCVLAADGSVSDEGGYIYQGLSVGYILGVDAAVGGAYSLYRAYLVVSRGQRRTSTRDVSVQSPTTHTRWRQEARFTPLPEHSWSTTVAGWEIGGSCGCVQ